MENPKCETCKNEIVIERGVRRQIVDKFEDYLVEIREAGVYVPNEVWDFVRERRTTEEHFDRAFVVQKLDDLEVCNDCYDKAVAEARMEGEDYE